jgi:hypothetical protein
MLRPVAGRDDERVTDLLDDFQAAELAGADALRRWIDVCNDPRLRGGLRVIEARDRSHATLALARLRALGGEPGAAIGHELAALCSLLGASHISDRSKLASLLARFPDRLHDPLDGVPGRLVGDDETRALLETIADDERASLAWLRRIHDLLDRETVWQTLA